MFILSTMSAVSFVMGTLMMMILGDVVTEGQNINFSFSHFDAANADKFLMVSDVKHDAANASFVLNPGSQELNSSCGKLWYREKVQMKDLRGEAASFHTSFTFQITAPARGTRGDGLSFVFARNITFSNETAGQFLCQLVNSSQLFAIEFDSAWNLSYSDPSDSHIGVDLNSVTSSWSYNLCGDSGVTNCSYLGNGGRFGAWIDFDGASHKLEVFFGNLSVKPQNPLITASIPSFADQVDEYMYVGFVGSSNGGSRELHEIHSWMFASTGVGVLGAADHPRGPNRPSVSSSMVGGIVAAAAFVTALAVACVRYPKCSSFRTRDKRISLVGESLTPRNFTYKKLSEATRRFSKSELLGYGGFGAVYRGCVDGEVVAVKRMRAHGQESFQAELASLSQIRHRNLVQLRGWCHEGDALMLVYDYMRHGSLDEWLHQFVKLQNAAERPFTLVGQQSLPLALRHSVLRGVSAGLLYLHDECAQCVLHRDIKSSNVLLDGDWNAYLGDFGLARVVDHQKRVEKTTMMAGTLGYLAPEISHTGKATKETDVYSFGVLVLEVISGKQPLAACGITQGAYGILVDSVWRAHEAGNIVRVADPTLLGPRDGGAADKKTLQNLLHVGLLCCNPNAEDRPSMRLVNLLLQSDRDMKKYMPPLPECKPQFHYARYGYPDVQSSDLMPKSTSTAPNVPDFALGSSLASSGVLSGDNPESFCTPDMSFLVAR